MQQNAPKAVGASIQEQGKSLYRNAMLAAVTEVSSTLNVLMAQTYYTMFQGPEQLEAFFLPLMKLDESKAPFAVIGRISFLKKCSAKTQKLARAKAKPNDKDRKWPNEKDYQKIPEEDFAKLLREEFQNASPQTARSYFESLDIAAWFKANNSGSSAKFQKIYDVMSAHFPQMGNKYDWSDLCYSALQIRNRLIGHSAPADMDKVREAGGPEKALADWLEIAKRLHDKKVNGREFQEFRKALDGAVEVEKSRVVSFQELEQSASMTHEAIRSALEAEGVRCGPDCALCSSKEALAERLERTMMKYRWFPLDSVGKFMGDDVPDLLSFLKDCGFQVKKGKQGWEIYCDSIGHVLKVLELRQAEADRRAQSGQLEALRNKLKWTEGQLEDLRNNAPQLYQRLERHGTVDWENLPRLEALAGCRKGGLSQDQLQELVRTHQIVLDPSLLRRGEGRAFVEKELIPRLQAMRQAGKEVYLVMEATARYHLYQEFDECKKAERTLRETSWTPAQEAARQKLERRVQELASARAAYYFAEDVLHRPGLLRYIGVPNPERRDEEALQIFLRRNPSLRVCVLTCGVSRQITEAVDPEEFPLCAVARVMKALPIPGRNNSPDCCIFDKFLPLAQGGKEVDLLDTLQQYYQLPPEHYGAASFGGDAPAETPSEKKPEAPPPAQALAKEDGKAVSSGEITAGGGKETASSPEPAGKEPEKAAPPPRTASAAKTPSPQNGPAFPPVSQLRVVEDVPLPLSRPVLIGDILMTDKEEPVRLTGRLRDGKENVEGGEGALYQVDAPGQVAKIYHSTPDRYRLTSSRKRKLEDMVAHDPHIKNLCWPTRLLYNQNREFVGYLMPKTPEGALTFQRSVLQIVRPYIQESVLPGWDRRDLVCVALATADMTARLHQNNILIGDVNDGNFMVHPKDSSQVYLVDCDSYQFDGYPCPVGTLDYTHPNTAARLGLKGDLRFEEFLRLEEEEDYTLGILLFRILMLAQYPFDTRNNEMSPAEAMRQKIFPFTVEEIADIPEGDSWMIWKNMPQKLTRAFLDTFKEWKAPTAREWATLLESYRYSIDFYHFTRELSPLKYMEFHPEDPFYQDVVCEIDQVEFNMPIRQYKWLTKQKAHILCAGCRRFLNLSEKRPRQLNCEICGQAFAGTDRQQYLKEKLGEPIYCPEHATVSVRCDGCKEDYAIPRQELGNKSYKWSYCPQCRKIETYSCEACGTEFSAQRGAYINEKKLRHPALCPDCRKAGSFQLTCCVCEKPFTLQGDKRRLYGRYTDGKGFYCDKHLLLRPTVKRGWEKEG